MHFKESAGGAMSSNDVMREEAFWERYQTEQTSVEWVERFVRTVRDREPGSVGAAEVREFLEALAVRGKVAASTQNQALNALVFFWREGLKRPLGELGEFERAKGPRRLPVVLSREEMKRVLGRMSGPHRLMALLMYGAGLRLMECVRLRVKDVDFERRFITVRDGKGAKDRMTMLPSSAVELMGHKDVSTTQIYTHVLNKPGMTVRSPADE